MTRSHFHFLNNVGFFLTTEGGIAKTEGHGEDYSVALRILLIPSSVLNLFHLVVP
jgi:hypothetical protein